MLRVQLTNEVVEKILNTVDELGRTQVSEDAGINRGELNDECISKLKLFRFVRVLVVIRFYLGEKRWQRWWNQVGEIIGKFSSDFSTYYQFVDENKKPRE